MSRGLKITLIIVGIILVLGFVLSRWFLGGYNSVVRMDENINGQWAQVENQLKRRYDLH
jgi:LemA protein